MNNKQLPLIGKTESYKKSRLRRVMSRFVHEKMKSVPSHPVYNSKLYFKL